MPSQLYLSKQNNWIFRCSVFLIFVIVRLTTASLLLIIIITHNCNLPNCVHNLPTYYSTLYDKMFQQLRQQQVNNNNNYQKTLPFPSSPPSPPRQSPIRFDHCCLNYIYIYIYKCINIYRWNNTRPQAVKMRRLALFSLLLLLLFMEGRGDAFSLSPSLIYLLS